MYIIQEIQTNGETVSVTPAVVESNKDEAESKFLLACSYAVKSSLDVHTVTCLTENGDHYFGSPKCYKHNTNT